MAPKARNQRSPAVVHITCPGCGGDVAGVELGESSKCRFCGKELHVPEMQLATDPPEREPPSEAPPPVRPAPGTSTTSLVLGAVVAVVAVIVVFSLVSSGPPAPHAAPRMAPMAANPDMEGISANAECVVSCNTPCAQIKDPEPMLQCFEACKSKCQYVGKGTRATCSARCDATCATAPDASRSACQSGCLQGCPP